MAQGALFDKLKDYWSIFVESILGSAPESAFLDKLETELESKRALTAGSIEELPARPIFAYDDPLIKRLIWLLKYQAHRHSSQILAKHLHEIILEDIAEEHIWRNVAKFTLVPIPLSNKRRKQKGFNPPALIALEVARMTPQYFEIREDILFKIKETKPQSQTSSRKERLENLKNCYEARGNLKGMNIILIDDVLTTGTTIKEAKKALRRSGAPRILSYTIAH
jgi:ComF family protein